mgnify:CR=1 FL=1
MTDNYLFEERAGIKQDSGLPKEQAEKEAREELHASEVKSVVRMYQEQGGVAVREYLLLVEKHRGKEAHDKLRMDALKEIK